MQDRKVRALVIASTLGALVASTACQSSSTNVVGPGGEKCAITLPQNLPSIGAEGGNGTPSDQRGRRMRLVGFEQHELDRDYLEQQRAGQRRGELRSRQQSGRVGPSRAVVVQQSARGADAGCGRVSFTLSPTTASIGSNGDEGDIAVTVAAGCQWSTTSGTPPRGCRWSAVKAGRARDPCATVSTRTAAPRAAAR